MGESSVSRGGVVCITFKSSVSRGESSVSRGESSLSRGESSVSRG